MALSFFKRFFGTDDPQAQFERGQSYDKMTKGHVDYAEAVKWYRKAAEQGNAYAQYNLGECYRYGNSVTKNRGKALRWYKLAAAQGHEDAQKAVKRLNAEIPKAQLCALMQILGAGKRHPNIPLIHPTHPDIPLIHPKRPNIPLIYPTHPSVLLQSPSVNKKP